MLHTTRKRQRLNFLTTKLPEAVNVTCANVVSLDSLKDAMSRKLGQDDLVRKRFTPPAKVAPLT